MPAKILVVWIVSFFITCSLVSQNSYTFVEKFQNTPLEKAFEVLAKKHNLKFSYENQVVANVKVSKRINAKDLSTALTQLFAGLELEYYITGTGQVLVRKMLPQEELSISEVKLKIPRKVSGTLIDAWTQQPLAFGHILCGQGEGVISDEQGRFELTLEDGSANTEVAVQYLGYQTRKTWIEPGTEPLDFKIRLTPKIEQLSGMTVTARLPMVSNKLKEDATVLRTQGLQRLPAFVNGADLMRSLQFLPGISAHDDLSADLSIRGGSGDENLIILDGITLYNVTHYFGIFSIINPQVPEEVKVYKNAFPAEYGGRTSAVVDIRSPQRNTDTKTVAVADINLITSSALLDIPIGKQFRLMGAGRITNQNLANSKLFNLLGAETQDTRQLKPGEKVRREVVSQKPELRFYDTNLKATWRPSARFSADFNYFSGEDTYGFAYNRESVKIFFNNREERVNEVYNENADWSNQGFSAQLQQKWSTRLSSNLNFSFSEYGIDRTYAQNIAAQLGPRRRTVFDFSNEHFNHIQGWNLNWKNEWRLNTRQKLVFGFENLINKGDLRIEEQNRALLTQNKQAVQQSLYGELQSSWADSSLNLSLGLRGTHYEGKNYLSPRLGLNMQVNDDFLLKTSWSIYQQFVYQFYHEDSYGRSYPYWVMAAEPWRFPVMTAHNFMLGANYRRKSFEFDAEFYVKNTNNIVEHARISLGLPNDSIPTVFRSFVGKGKTVGMDLLLKKSFRDYETWIAYTLSKSTQQFGQIYNGLAFPAPNDRRHQLKWINQYRWKKFDFSLAYVFASGRPFTDLSIIGGDKSPERVEIEPANRLSYLEDYHRVDLAATYNFSIGKTKVQANLSFFNLFDHENVKYRQYIYSFVPINPRTGQMEQNTVQGLELQSLDFTTSVGVVLRF